MRETSFDLAKTTNDKWQQLFKQGVVSDLDAKDKEAAQGEAAANLDNNKANVKRLEDLQGFQKVTAPFAGTITIRNVEVGDLISANAGGKEMFHIQQTQSLRVYFRVPQAEAPDIAAGQTFDVLVGTQGGNTYPGKVVTTSEAVSPVSRTMEVELQVDNSQNQIKPGSYATVRLPQSVSGKLLTLPDNTLIFRGKDLQVAAVNAKGVVELRDVKVGQDFGIQSEILGGVTEFDKVIVNPPDSITTGAIVPVAATPSPAGKKRNDKITINNEKYAVQTKNYYPDAPHNQIYVGNKRSSLQALRCARLTLVRGHIPRCGPRVVLFCAIGSFGIDISQAIVTSLAR